MVRTLKAPQNLVGERDGQRWHAKIEPPTSLKREMVEERLDLRMRTRTHEVSGGLRLAQDLETRGKVGCEQVRAVAVYAVRPIAAVTIVIYEH